MRILLFSLTASTVLMASACNGGESSTEVAIADPAHISTSSGVLVGKEETGVIAFKGVPYAQPPVGDLRWAPPQPVSWDGEFTAQEFALPCLQPTSADGTPNGAGVTGASSEDCLYLNVWRPMMAQGAPIMLFLYGGGGTMGAGSVSTYDGTAFARDGVVLVTINYRLGALGGFAHPALTADAGDKAFANYHLLDTMAALTWIKDNAKAFGGDPNNITLFGESAGATMVANLITTPSAQGLFSKAIIESTGSLPTPGTPLAAAEERGAAFATAHGLDGADATLAELKAIPAANIIADRATRGGLRTIIDGRTKQQSILDAFEAGNEIEIPFILGTNSDEGRLFGTQRVATQAMDGAPVWQYFFDYVPGVRRADNPNGAPHAAELPFVFDTLALDRRIAGSVTAEDSNVASYVHDCWVAFAKLPIGETSITCGGGFVWPSRTEANAQTVALFQSAPSLAKAADLRSPPNGAEPGPTSRDVE